MTEIGTKTIRLPCFGIVIILETEGSGFDYRINGSGRITSDLHEDEEDDADNRLDAAFDAIEGVILAHACAGVNVEDHAYVEGIETAVFAATDNLT